MAITRHKAPPAQTARTALIDADIIAFQAAAVAQGHIGEDGQPTRAAVNTMRNVMEYRINNIHITTGATEARYFLTSGGKASQFRYRVDAQYKAQRKAQERPAMLGRARQYLIDTYGAEESPIFEADDRLAQEQQEGETIICTIDKDLAMVIGLHYNWNRKEIFKTDLLEASRRFWGQMLTGDATDNIPGVPGFGKAKAAKWVAANVVAGMYNTDLYDEVMAIYTASRDALMASDKKLTKAGVRMVEAGSAEERFKKNAALLYMWDTEDGANCPAFLKGKRFNIKANAWEMVK